MSSEVPALNIEDGSLVYSESRNYWVRKEIEVVNRKTCSPMSRCQNINYAQNISNCTPAYNSSCSPSPDKPNLGLVGLPYECLCDPLACNTQEIKQLREQLNQVKQDYENQMAACKRISNLVKKVAPEALKSKLRVDPHENVTERLEIQTGQKSQEELNMYQCPGEEENTGQPPEVSAPLAVPYPPFSAEGFQRGAPINDDGGDERGEEGMPLLPPSNLPRNLPGMDQIEMPKDSVCDQFKDQLNVYSEQIRNKDQVIECIEINLLRLDRQGTLIEKNFKDIEERYKVLMDQYHDLEDNASQGQRKMKNIEDMVPEEEQNFKKSILKIMLKLETDLVNSEKYMKVQNGLDAERKLLTAALAKNKSERIQLINKRARVQMRFDHQVRNIRENAGKHEPTKEFLQMPCCSKGRGEQAENPFILDLEEIPPTMLKPRRKSSIREAFNIQDGVERMSAAVKQTVEI